MKSKPDIGAMMLSSSTLKDFCERHSISKTLWRKLQKTGRGPAFYRLGRQTIRITTTAEAAWLRARQEPGKAEAQMMERAVDSLRKQSVKAAAKSLASPKHPASLKAKRDQSRAKG